MFIFITVGILLFTALTLIVVRSIWSEVRYAWLMAAVGALLAWISVFAWQTQIPLVAQLAPWKPEAVFRQSPLFVIDGISWAFALSIASVGVSVIVTAVARDNFPNPLSWIGVLGLTALGVLAVTADNPLTLVLLWAAIDLTEMVSQIRFVEDPKHSEKIVVSFASRMAGTLILLWASMISASHGVTLDFLSPPPQAGLYLVIASGFRLGVLPLHMPYASESAYRRGFGTAMRMVSAGSSLILLTRASLSGVDTPLTPVIMALITFAAFFGSWMWLRSPDELTGRPYWSIGIGALAMASALRANPIGATAWSCALILSGSALFLASAENKWIGKTLWVGAWGISALPLSITATGWINNQGRVWYSTPFLLLAQAVLLAGYIRQNQRASRTTFENQPIWAKDIYPLGIYINLLTIILLGFFGWGGTLALGNWFASLAASLLTFSLLWLTPRVRILNPVRTHWVRTNEPTWLDAIRQIFWGLYRTGGKLLDIFSSAFEGESGIMWTLLFLTLFITIFTQGTP